mgnify:CR=1 FL=1
MREPYLNLYGPWGEHPEYPVEDWKSEVANDETRLGYWPWVASRTEHSQTQVPSLPN